MCGIYGEVARSPIDQARARSATDRLRHRGPDSSGAWAGDGVFLGMRRLSIIDLAGGQQPIWNEDESCCIVFNGELYNFIDLRRELQGHGHVFRSRSDTEVVLHAYEEWGTDCLRRFNGMFAIAIWDGPRRRLFLARDRIGEKPLYYYRDGRRLVFASEIKAILAHPKVPRDLNPRGLANFLAFGHAVAPETIYRDIHKLLPGHYLVVRDGDVRIVEYWDVGQDGQAPSGENSSEEEHEAHIRSLLDDSVRLRMTADVSVGAFLSGGLDSSAIVALMTRHAAGSVKTFSLGFPGGGAYDELADARMVAQHFGTEHHALRVEHADLVHTLRTLVYHYDEPFGDPAGFPVYMLSRFARDHVKVVLAGDGGDELFGGYRRYAVDRFAPLYQRLPATLTGTVIPALVERFPRLRRTKRSLQTLPIPDPARRYPSWLMLFSPAMEAELLEGGRYDAVAGYDPAEHYSQYYHRMNGQTASDHLNRLMYVDVKTWLADAYMEKVDKATMACGLEARLPLLDHRLVERAFQIPGRYKIRGRSMKRIFKRAVRDLVPAPVLRKPKHGFSVPLDPWFRGELKSFSFEVLLDERTRRRGYFNAAFVERLWREHVEGRQIWDAHLWQLLNFELWHRIYLDGESV
ncbi:MAG TPA: asparagine synthase (glutamine-hydrolyzing) [Methylomirabilota bacterium]|nr:asparagine synthase (glutamine-hydrolyzing) [Methylomirabilota bacterium]